MDLKATSISGHTLIGVYGKPPYEHGNCFSVLAEDGNYYQIVNFVHENLEHLFSAGLTWPINIRVLWGQVAVIHDKRIPHVWYRDNFCEVCCPENLLPIPQRLRHEREVMQGVREERNGFVTINFREPDCLVKPNDGGER